jgi:hypothetical protein
MKCKLNEVGPIDLQPNDTVSANLSICLDGEQSQGNPNVASLQSR